MRCRARHVPPLLCSTLKTSPGAPTIAWYAAAIHPFTCHWCICTCAVHTEFCLRRTTGTAGCDVSRASVRDATRQLRRKPRSVTLAEITAENDFKNDLVLWVLPRQLRNAMPRVVQSWVSMQWCGAKAPYSAMRHTTAGNPPAPFASLGCVAGPELPHVLGSVRGSRSRLGLVHLRAFGSTLFRGRGRPTFRAMASQVG